MNITEWANRLNIRPHTLLHRIKRGWPLDRELTSGHAVRKNKTGFPGVVKSRHEVSWSSWCRVNGKRRYVGSGRSPKEAYMLKVEFAKENGINLPEGDMFCD
jgi:hypothetical protein